VDAVKRLCSSLNIPKNLREVGVKADKIHEMSVDAMKSGNVLVNPRHTTLADIEALYTKAM
ncbi:MAG: iron-containing alcohol dehydrogenase, partial [Clostridiales Family XIII bacterium]|nr:iron-containing alcohol dehydrogenase [Clostridiales Family XIII bacterium]